MIGGLRDAQLGRWRTRWCIVLAGIAALQPPRAGALFFPVESEGVPWFWTPIIRYAGLAPNATVRVEIRTSRPCPNAFVVLFSESQYRECKRELFQRGLQLSSRLPWPSTYLPCTWRASLKDPVNMTHQLQAPAAAIYALGILQAMPGAAEGLSGEVGYINPDGNQLPLEHNGRASVVLLMAWAFFGSAVLLLTLCRRRGRSRLHLLLLTALLTKCVVLLLTRYDIEELARTGRQSLNRQVLLQFCRQVQLILEVMVFYVIGLGWKVMRQRLRASEWAFASTISSLSFLLGLFEVACNTVAVCTSSGYLLTQFTLHSLVFLVVIIATNFNIFTLQRQIAEALAAPETSGLYAKHRAYCWFRGFFLYFVILPTVGNFLTLHVVSWDERWVIVFVEEGSRWVIYTAVLWLFRPGMSQLRVFELAVVEPTDSEGDSQE